MRRSLLVGDLHLTANSRDDYRWDVFSTIAKFAKYDGEGKRKVDRVFFLGDITEAKDRHTGVLVNRLVDAFCKLRVDIPEIWILRGNHDGLDPDCPFFSFFRYIPEINFIIKPKLYPIFSKRVLLLPHSRSPIKDWAELHKKADYLLLHATVHGAVSETGHELESQVTADMFDRFHAKRIYSGDVHVPQTIGKITYVGTPYPIRFGDTFKPRMIYLDDDEQENSIRLKTLRKLTLDVKSAADFAPRLTTILANGPVQLKVRVHLDADDLGRWEKERREIITLCRSKGVEVVLVEPIKRPALEQETTTAVVLKQPDDVLASYSRSKKLKPKIVAVGTDLLHRARDGR